MFKPFELSKNKEENYKQILIHLEAILEDESFTLSNYANTAALLYYSLSDINWAGFYFYDENVLKLGPFLGLPACTKLSLDKGVCAKAFNDEKTLIVDNVHDFPGHIACDSASQSEIVIPIIKNNKCLGVLDIDAPILSRFDEIDKHYLELIVQKLNQKTKETF